MTEEENKKTLEGKNLAEFLEAFNQQIVAIDKKIESVIDELSPLNEDKKNLLGEMLTLENHDEALTTLGEMRKVEGMKINISVEEMKKEKEEE